MSWLGTSMTARTAAEGFSNGAYAEDDVVSVWFNAESATSAALFKAGKKDYRLHVEGKGEVEQYTQDFITDYAIQKAEGDLEHFY